MGSHIQFLPLLQVPDQHNLTTSILSLKEAMLLVMVTLIMRELHSSCARYSILTMCTCSALFVAHFSFVLVLILSRYANVLITPVNIIILSYYDVLFFFYL